MANYFFALEVFFLTIINIKVVGNPWQKNIAPSNLIWSSARAAKTSTVKFSVTSTYKPMYNTTSNKKKVKFDTRF